MYYLNIRTNEIDILRDLRKFAQRFQLSVERSSSWDLADTRGGSRGGGLGG